MTDTAKILQQAHAELWAFRDEMGDAWPTPDTLDALRFAVTEAGEALDAWMRANRPQYARNRERLDWDGAVLDELADCAMMLLTAVGPDLPNGFIGDWPIPFDWDIDWIVWQASRRLASGNDPFEREDNELIQFSARLHVVWGIAAYPGMDLLPRLRSRYARIRAKHGRPANGKHPAIMPKVIYITGNGHDLADEHNIEPGVTHYGTTYGTDTL